jgi:hypothetical protein
MSQPSSSSSFQSLFDAALQDYATQTGTKLDDQPLAKQLQDCDSVDSVLSVLQSQARIFHQFRGEDGKIMRSLKSVVHVLYNFSTSGVLGEGVGIVRPKSLIAQPYLQYILLSRGHLQKQYLLLSPSCSLYVSFTIPMNICL